MLDNFLFAIFPYLAVILALVFGIHRFRSDSFSQSSLSTQFLESRKLFWGSVPWHFGIILILLAHLCSVLFPGVWASILGEPTRLYLVEITGLALGGITVVGLSWLIYRRITNPRITVVTSVMDWVLLAFLLLQVGTGVYTALVYRWGSLWALESAQPWLFSLLTLNPEIHYITGLPWVFKLHITSALMLVLLLPFTRLIHIVSVPLGFLTRPHQLVVWNRDYKPSSVKEKKGEDEHFRVYFDKSNK